MGGGGVMRTAAKVAGIGVATTGLRGVPLAPPAEQSVRNASRSVSAVVSSEGAKAAEVAPLHTAASWDMDDWEFAGDGELVMQAGEPMPRVVFGGVPTFQEAKAATTELKDAIDQIFLSSKSTESEGSSDSPMSVRSPYHPELETESCVIEAISASSVPKHAMQAFQLLSSSPEAQTVVASVACDSNVWNAVMQNPVLTEFCQSRQKAIDFVVEESPKLEELHDSDQTGSPKSRFNHFRRLLQNIKLTVVEMVCGMSNYFQNIFGFSATDKTAPDDDGNAKADFTDPLIMGRTVMGLAVLVVMIVLLKRA